MSKLSRVSKTVAPVAVDPGRVIFALSQAVSQVGRAVFALSRAVFALSRVISEISRSIAELAHAIAPAGQTVPFNLPLHQTRATIAQTLPLTTLEVSLVASACRHFVM